VSFVPVGVFSELDRVPIQIFLSASQASSGAL
jgi:hypothetical protein